MGTLPGPLVSDGLAKPVCLVIGAGPAGLAAAWSLEQHGVSTIVLESADRVGGRTETLWLNGARLNTGAAFFTSFYPETLRLCRTLGVELAPPPIHPTRTGTLRAMRTARGTVPYAPGTLSGLWRFPFVPPSEKIRLVAGVTRLALGRPLHIADPQTLVDDDGESAAEWACRTLGDGAYHYFVRAAVEPFFYSEAEEVSAAVAKALLRHAVHWRLLTPRDGMSRFCEALASRLTCRLACSAKSIVWKSRRLCVRHAEGETDADAVVVAIPAPQALRLAPVTEEDEKDLEAIRYQPSVLAFLGYDAPLNLTPPSVANGGPGRHRLVGVTALGRGGMSGFIPPPNDVLAVLAMGWRSRELLDDGDDAALDALTQDARALVPALPAAAWTRVCARRYATVVSAPGLMRRVVAFARRERRGVHFAGDWLSGASTVEGAVRSGYAAARSVIRDLSTR